MHNKNIAILEMIICSTLWSIAGLFMKWLPWSGFTIASLRAVFAGLTIFIYILISGNKLYINKSTVLAGILTGSVAICFSIANKLTTAANAIVLQFTAPVFVVVISYVFFKTKIVFKDIITVILTLLGISLFFFDQLKNGYILGNIIAVISGLLMASMYIVIGTIEKKQKLSVIFIAQLFSFLVGFPSVLMTKPVITQDSIIYIMVLGVFQLGIAYILYVKSSEYCPPLACCLLGVIEPLLNPLWVMIFYGEKPGLYALIGGIIIIITVTIWCISGINNESDTIKGKS